MADDFYSKKAIGERIRARLKPQPTSLQRLRVVARQRRNVRVS